MNADSLKREMGNRIAAARERAGMNKRQFALKCGLVPNYLSRVESGQRWVGADVLATILSGLGTTLLGLVGGQAGQAWELAERLARTDPARLRAVAALVPELEDLAPPAPVVALTQADRDLADLKAVVTRIWYRGMPDDRHCVVTMLRRLDPGPDDAQQAGAPSRKGGAS